MIIKWKNKYSGEEGFVERVNKDGKDFVNTIDASAAKNFTESAAQKHIASLNEFQSQNTYETVETKPKAEKHPKALKSAKAQSAKKPAAKKTAPKKPAASAESLS